jgi:hypothetical protein
MPTSIYQSRVCGVCEDLCCVNCSEKMDCCINAANESICVHCVCTNCQWWRKVSGLSFCYSWGKLTGDGADIFWSDVFRCFNIHEMPALISGNYIMQKYRSQ